MALSVASWRAPPPHQEKRSTWSSAGPGLCSPHSMSGCSGTIGLYVVSCLSPVIVHEKAGCTPLSRCRTGVAGRSSAEAKACGYRAALQIVGQVLQLVSGHTRRSVGTWSPGRNAQTLRCPCVPCVRKRAVHQGDAVGLWNVPPADTCALAGCRNLTLRPDCRCFRRSMRLVGRHAAGRTPPSTTKRDRHPSEADNGASCMIHFGGADEARYERRWPGARTSAVGVSTCWMVPSLSTQMRSPMVMASTWSWVTYTTVDGRPVFAQGAVQIRSGARAWTGAQLGIQVGQRLIEQEHLGAS